jgi:NTP pyrophosphatase (non-canonical NTP hydrolase)
MSKGWIGVDLDGTLAHYNGWKGPDHIGKPVLKMLERVKLWMAVDKYEIRIFTARAGVPEQIPPVVAWLEKHGIGGLAITNVKDFSMVELWDDRCVQIIPNQGISIVDHLHATIDGLSFWTIDGLSFWTALIAAERQRQDAKWGEQNHDDFKWLSILMEEVGEVSKAALEHDGPGVLKELSHAAAVAVAHIEALGRRATKETT